MPEQPKDLWTQFLEFLSKIVTPDWGGLINLLPFGVMVLVVLFAAHTALQWFRWTPLNRTRVPKPLTSGALPPGVHLPGPSRWPFVLPVGAFFILISLALRPRGPGTETAPPLDLPLFGLGVLIIGVAIVGWLWDAMREWRRTDGLERTDGHGLPALAIGAGTVAHLHPAAALAPEAARAASMVGTNVLAVARSSAAEPVHDLPPGIHLPGPSPWPFFLPISALFVLFGLVLSPALSLGGLVMGLIAVAGWLRDAGWEYRQTDRGIAPEPRSRDPRRAFPMSLVKVYVLIAALSVAAIVAPGVITSVLTRPTTPPVASPGASPGVPSGQLSLVAKDIKFNVDHLVAPAAKPFEIVLDNQDVVLHNVAIFAGADASGENRFRGELFTGPKSVTYMVPALAAGSYYFHCDVHPNMKGTLDAQ